MHTTAPTLTTPRLTLSAPALADFRDSFALWSDPEVVRFIGGRPFTREEVWGRLHRYVGHWALLGFGSWTVRDLATGRFVGDVGLFDFHRDVDPPYDGVPEAGWVLATWAHGKGLATEAVRAVLAWAETDLRTPRTVCMIDEGNARSIRVAAKCGYKEWRKTAYKGAPVTLFER
ncbi:MAG: GNAT family N-acetyltransferase [Polyangiaceae bacterium]